jgi:hypothetical protein
MNESQFLPKPKRAGSTVFARLSSMDLIPRFVLAIPVPESYRRPPGSAARRAIHYVVSGRELLYL